jgi:hypothetical protein
MASVVIDFNTPALIIEVIDLLAYESGKSRIIRNKQFNSLSSVSILPAAFIRGPILKTTSSMVRTLLISDSLMIPSVCPRGFVKLFHP